MGGDGGSAKTMDAGHRAMTWPARGIRVEARERRVFRVGRRDRSSRRRDGAGRANDDVAKKKSGRFLKGAKPTGVDGGGDEASALRLRSVRER